MGYPSRKRLGNTVLEKYFIALQIQEMQGLDDKIKPDMEENAFQLSYFEDRRKR